MTGKEFYKAYKGRRVRYKCSKGTCWDAWIGEVVNYYRDELVDVETIHDGAQLPDSYCKGEVGHFHISNLILLDDEPLTINLPENNHLCPKCRKTSCKGLDQLECVARS